VYSRNRLSGDDGERHDCAEAYWRALLPGKPMRRLQVQVDRPPSVLRNEEMAPDPSTKSAGSGADAHPWTYPSPTGSPTDSAEEHFFFQMP
jgi:hypothetical protein